MTFDPMEEVFGLEDQYVQEGFELGLKDGAKAGFSEGVEMGHEQGFERHIEFGRLYARARIWAARLPDIAPRLYRDEVSSTAVELTMHENTKGTSDDSKHTREITPTVGRLSENPRLRKHLDILLRLVDPTTLVLENTESAGTGFEDRSRRARSKLKVIEKIINESADKEVIGSGNDDGKTGRAMSVRNAEHKFKDGVGPSQKLWPDFQDEFPAVHMVLAARI
ncbi:MAG: hypothetical protein M1825_003347 [Sarcosagium campestre]|nr:MAG: hypothetical protein M1825_003347 [Sarcosagium campestre]